MNKPVGTLIAALALMICASPAQTVVYTQNFETGLKPDGWVTWDVFGTFPGSWNYMPAIDGRFSCAFEASPGFDLGAFCVLPRALDEVTVTFSFRCSSYPSQYVLEVIDLYDGSGNEVADLYLNPQGQLLLTIGGSTGTISKPIPINKTISVQLHYSTLPAPASASATWSCADSVFGGEINGAYRTDGQYTSPVTQLLLGPVAAPVLFVYDDLVVTTR